MIGQRLFILSPARCDGERARLIFRNPARFELALKLRTPQGAPIGETDDMALAGILSSQLVYHQFVVDYQTAPPLSQADDVKVCLEQATSKSD